MATALQKALPKEYTALLRLERDLKLHLRENFTKLGAKVEIDVKCEKGAIINLRLETGDKVLIFELKCLFGEALVAVEWIKRKETCRIEVSLRCTE